MRNILSFLLFCLCLFSVGIGLILIIGGFVELNVYLLVFGCLLLSAGITKMVGHDK
jgi:hypothetical protein